MSLATTDAEGQIDDRTLPNVHLIEKILKQASLSKIERVRANATLYQVLKVLNEHHAGKNLWSINEAVKLTIAGDTPADVKLQRVLEGFKNRRAQSASPTVPNA